MSDIYIIGHCTKCNRHAPLKNGLCIYCNARTRAEVPDFIQDLFRKKDNDDTQVD